jgi:hypothetical protein
MRRRCAGSVVAAVTVALLAGCQGVATDGFPDPGVSLSPGGARSDGGGGPPADPLAALREKYAELADALTQLPEVADGLQGEEPRALADTAKILLALDPAGVRHLIPALIGREATPLVDDHAMVADGNLADWPASAAVSPDRAGEVRSDLDVLEVRFAVSAANLWMGATLAAGCTSKLAMQVEVDVDRGPESDVVVLAYSDPSYNEIQYYTTADSYTDLAVSGLQWRCSGKTVEIKVPLAAFAAHPRKPLGWVRLTTLDATGTAEQALWDPTRAFPLVGARTRGALQELFRLCLAEPRAVEDPGATVALAVESRFFAEVVRPELLPAVAQDSLNLLRFALDLPAWQAAHGVPASFASLPLEEKLTWAGRGEQSLTYGTFHVAAEMERLNEPRYRFDAYTSADLSWFRDLFVRQKLTTASLPEMVGAIEDWLWTALHYTTDATTMDTWCANGSLDQQTCDWWAKDKAAGQLTLGTVDGVSVANYDGMSASLQAQLYRDKGYFKGDCGTHTTIAIAILRSLGIAATGMQYLPSDPSVDLATHDFPIHYEPAANAWTAYQIPDDDAIQSYRTLTYYFYPVRDPLSYLLRHGDPDGLELGDAVHSVWSLTYSELAAMLRSGLAHSDWQQSFWAAYPSSVQKVHSFVGPSPPRPIRAGRSRALLPGSTVPRALRRPYLNAL